MEGNGSVEKLDYLPPIPKKDRIKPLWVDRKDKPQQWRMGVTRDV